MLAKLEPRSSRPVLACEEELGNGVQVIRVGGVELFSLFSSSTLTPVCLVPLFAQVRAHNNAARSKKIKAQGRIRQARGTAKTRNFGPNDGNTKHLQNPLLMPPEVAATTACSHGAIQPRQSCLGF